ncbi:MAG: molybdate transport system ATP-binding protein [Urechidicola sp.]|jgi:molybdate transport system ATP-binding protein
MNNTNQASNGISIKISQQQPIPLAVDIECRAGELLALVGPSGSGKSTILRTIAGLHQPQTGFIRCDDEVWFDDQQSISIATQNRHIGFVFQDYALFPHLSALQNVVIALGHIDRNARDARAKVLLAQVNLKGLEHRMSDDLSGGQRQRVALARALAREPKVLLLDEPFSAVDQMTRRKLQQELVILRRNIKIPILLVTHDLDEAAMLADRLTVLHKGKTLQHGVPAEILRHPVDALVARLMGHTNIFSATIEGHYPEQGLTRIVWYGLLLELELNKSFVMGTTVDWVIHPAHIIMHRRGRPSHGERENPVHGIVKELLVLGETSIVSLKIKCDGNVFLNFKISSHSASRNNLKAGAEASVSLLTEGIHLMPPYQ